MFSINNPATRCGGLNRPDMQKKMASCITVVVFALLAASCQLVSYVPAKIAPGTVGFYDLDPSQSRIVTEDMKVTRMSIPGDRVFVYRVNEDMIVLGAGDVNANAKIKPLNEVSSGVVITPDAAKKLAAFLEKVIAQYNVKDKKISQYMDFRILSTGAVVATANKEAPATAGGKEAPVTAAGKEGLTSVETIYLRIQYVYNMVQLEDAELTLCYFGGPASKELKALKINEITALITSLQKN